MRFRRKPNIGKHHALISGQRVLVLPGATIECEPHDLGNFISGYEALDPFPPEPPTNTEFGLVAVHRGHGRWDVINESSGERINTKALTKAEAEALATKGLDELTNAAEHEDDAATNQGEDGDGQGGEAAKALEGSENLG